MLQPTMKAPPQLRTPGWYRLPGLVVALAGILASYGWWQYQEGVMQSLANARFERQALAVADALQRRVQTKGDLLMGLRGLLMVNPDLPRADFERVAQSLKLDMGHGSVLNLHFTRAVPAAERSAFEVGARADPHVDGSLPSHFTIHPVLDVSEHFVVDFVWPVQGNEQVQGLDIQSQSANVQGYLVARDTGALVVTAPFSMAQEGPGGRPSTSGCQCSCRRRQASSRAFWAPWGRWSASASWWTACATGATWTGCCCPCTTSGWPRTRSRSHPSRCTWATTFPWAAGTSGMTCRWAGGCGAWRSPARSPS